MRSDRRKPIEIYGGHRRAGTEGEGLGGGLPGGWVEEILGAGNRSPFFFRGRDFLGDGFLRADGGI